MSQLIFHHAFINKFLRCLIPCERNWLETRKDELADKQNNINNIQPATGLDSISGINFLEIDKIKMIGIKGYKISWRNQSLNFKNTGVWKTIQTVSKWLIKDTITHIIAAASEPKIGTKYSNKGIVMNTVTHLINVIFFIQEKVSNILKDIVLMPLKKKPNEAIERII